jgi:hypothetical protein
MPIDIYEKDDIDALADEIRNCKGGGSPMTVKEMTEEIRNVKEVGFSDGYSEGQTYGENIGREQGLEEGKAIGYTEGKTDGIAEGIEQGKKSQYDEFWDGFQNYGNRAEYAYAFSYTAWESVKPKYKIIPTTAMGISCIFMSASKIKKIEAKHFDFSQVPRGLYVNTGLNYSFASCIALEEIEDIGLPSSFALTYTFAWCGALHTIARVRIDEDTRITNAFDSLRQLKNLTIEDTIGQNGFNVQWSTKLSKASITSIINALSTTTSGLTVTLSKTAVNNAFNGGSTGDEWLNLVATKNNWTISLV